MYNIFNNILKRQSNVMKRINLFYFLCLATIFVACSSDEEFINVDTKTEILTRSIDINDIILPIEGDRDTLKRPLQNRAPYDIQEEINQLEGIPFYLQVQGNSTTNQFLNATEAGTEVTVAEYGGNIEQQFNIRILPATSGIPYLIYSSKTGTPIRLGVYNSNPDVKILYADYTDTSSLFGASWDFRKGTYTPNSFVIENQDSPQQGSSGNWWDIYYPAITVNDTKVSFSKYNNSPRQEFAIVPAETFQVEEIKYNIDASAVLEKMPDIVYFDRYTNRGPIQQSHKFIITESYKETSNFSRKTSYNVDISTKVTTKIPFIAAGEITTSTSFGQDYTYGESEEKSIAINREYPVDVPANHKAELSLTLFKYNMDVEYIAICRGLTSGKRISIKGRWTGVDVVETDAVLEVFPLDGGPSTRMVITKEMLRSGTPINVK